MTTSFITTAIPYVNARPHVGFAYELVLADVLARHRRLRGYDVRFITGTDDHSLKNVVAAEREGISTQALVDRNAAAFDELAPLLAITRDDFIRTSADARHRIAVDWLWRACKHDLYRREWQGRYCPGCEAFVDDHVVVCDEHGIAPEPVCEENWFFRLSRWREPIREAIESGRLAIVPDAARAETLAFLAGPVRDLSVSRVATRAGGWGIPVPDDPTQVIYVWFDALANYVASLGLGGDDSALLDRYWCAERTHVIGKGITRFHAVYWPAFLLSAGLSLPERIFVHGYLTVDGEKIRKSGRNVEVPPVVEQTSIDAVRWYFVRRCRTRTDNDVSVDAIRAAHDGDLADRFGNLVHRCTTLAAKLGCSAPATTELHAPLAARVDRALDAFACDEAVGAIVELVDEANRALEVSAPWRLAKTDRAAAAAALQWPLAAARAAVSELAPFVPETARVLAARLDGAHDPRPPIQRYRRTVAL